MRITLTASHICYGTSSIDEAQAMLLDLGRDSIFQQEPGPVPSEKRPFVRPQSSSQQMLYTHSKSGIGIELLKHEPLVASESDGDTGPFLPIYTCAEIPQDCERSSLSERLGVAVFTSASFSVNPILFAQAQPGSDYTGVGRIVLFTPDRARSADFLRLGFAFEERQGGVFYVHSLTGRPLEIQVLKEAAVSTPYLDSCGWVCLSFEVKNVERALEQLRQEGASEVGVPFQYTAGKREFRVAFVRGPSGELYELLETTKIIR